MVCLTLIEPKQELTERLPRPPPCLVACFRSVETPRFDVTPVSAAPVASGSPVSYQVSGVAESEAFFIGEGDVTLHVRVIGEGDATLHVTVSLQHIVRLTRQQPSWLKIELTDDTGRVARRLFWIVLLPTVTPVRVSGKPGVRRRSVLVCGEGCFE